MNNEDILYVWPNGDVIHCYSGSWMSDDYFTINMDTMPLAEAAELIKKHFGETTQANNVLEEVKEYYGK